MMLRYAITLLAAAQFVSGNKLSLRLQSCEMRNPLFMAVQAFTKHVCMRVECFVIL